EGGDVDALRVANGAVTVADGDDLDAARHQFLTGDRADVAETLHDGGGLAGVLADFLECLHDAIDDAAAGRLAAAHAAAQLHRLARHDLGRRVADPHRVRVHDPCHGLLVGAQVGRHDVHARTDDRQNLDGEAARQAFFLVYGELFGIDGDAALGAP